MTAAVVDAAHRALAECGCGRCARDAEPECVVITQSEIDEMFADVFGEV